MSDDSDVELSVGAPSPVGRRFHRRVSPPLQRETTTVAKRSTTGGMAGGEDADDVSTVDRHDRSSNYSGPNGSCGSGVHRNPTCALCKNHQVINTLKGHKRYCPWRSCLCELCFSTNKKRKVNAEQVAVRRAHAQDEELRVKGLIQQLPTAPSTVPHQPSMSSGRAEGTLSSGRIIGINGSAPTEQRPSAAAAACRVAQPSAAVGCTQSGPMVVGQQLSLGSILMSQNVSLLRNSVCDSTLDTDTLNLLCRMVHQVKSEMERVSFQLDNIHQEIQLNMHTGKWSLVAAATTSGPVANLFGRPTTDGRQPTYAIRLNRNQQQVHKNFLGVPLVVHGHPYAIPSSFVSYSRPSVINGPRPAVL